MFCEQSQHWRVVAEFTAPQEQALDTPVRQLLVLLEHILGIDVLLVQPETIAIAMGEQMQISHGLTV